MPLSEDKVFGGRYEVVAFINSGGFGSVYKVRDRRFREVYRALKTLNTATIEPAELDLFLQKFADEANVQVNLRHPGIVTVYDFDPDPSEPFIVMELIEGGTLGALLKQRRDQPLTWVEVADLGVQIAEALHYAHTHGVSAHRDIKPGNIFCPGQGKYLVGDFGIARAPKRVGGATRLTFRGAAGTPEYMAPEQFLPPYEVDGRADEFALAVVLYQTLARKTPYPGVMITNVDEDPERARDMVFHAINAKRLELGRLAPSTPAALVDVIHRALQPAVTDRFVTCGALAEALRTIPRGAPASIVAPSGEPRDTPDSQPAPTTPVQVRGDEAARAQPAAAEPEREAAATIRVAPTPDRTIVAPGRLVQGAQVPQGSAAEPDAGQAPRSGPVADNPAARPPHSVSSADMPAAPAPLETLKVPRSTTPPQPPALDAAVAARDGRAAPAPNRELAATVLRPDAVGDAQATVGARVGEVDEESRTPLSSAVPPVVGDGGRYRIERKLGSGAFGVVYRAQDTRLNRPVAIKFLKAEAAESRNLVASFQEEAKKASGLDEHPNIVRVHDFGTDPTSGLWYIVFQLMEGGTLRAELDRTPRMDWENVQRVGVQVAGALHYAHQRRIQAHRDIKPENIFVSGDGNYFKVGDFGIARRRPTAETKQSTIGALGTPQYMAPEQWLTPAHVEGPTADQFSLAVVLYEAIAGCRPFEVAVNPEGTPEKIERQIQLSYETPTPLQEIVRGAPRQLCAVIQKALSFYPDDRFQDCGEFQRALRDFDPDDETIVPEIKPAPVSRRRPVLYALGGLALLVAVGAVVAQQLGVKPPWEKTPTPVAEVVPPPPLIVYPTATRSAVSGSPAATQSATATLSPTSTPASSPSMTRGVAATPTPDLGLRAAEKALDSAAKAKQAAKPWGQEKELPRTKDLFAASEEKLNKAARLKARDPEQAEAQAREAEKGFLGVPEVGAAELGALVEAAQQKAHAACESVPVTAREGKLYQDALKATAEAESSNLRSLSGLKQAREKYTQAMQTCKKVSAPTPTPSGLKPPIIKSLDVNSDDARVGGQVRLAVAVSDPDGDAVTCVFSIDNVEMARGDCVYDWRPSRAGQFSVSVRAVDSSGQSSLRDVSTTVRIPDPSSTPVPPPPPPSGNLGSPHAWVKNHCEQEVSKAGYVCTEQEIERLSSGKYQVKLAIEGSFSVQHKTCTLDCNSSPCLKVECKVSPPVPK